MSPLVLNKILLVHGKNVFNHRSITMVYYNLKKILTLKQCIEVHSSAFGNEPPSETMCAAATLVQIKKGFTEQRFAIWYCLPHDLTEQRQHVK
jgi:hypothetical protein